MKKLIYLFLFILCANILKADIRVFKDQLEEGNDGYATWAYTNQYGDTVAPASACFYVYDEKTDTLQFSQCTNTSDDIQEFSFTPCGTRIVDNGNLSEAKIFSTVWTYPASNPILTGQRSYRVWVNNSGAVTVNEISTNVCTATNN